MTGFFMAPKEPAKEEDAPSITLRSLAGPVDRDVASAGERGYSYGIVPPSLANVASLLDNADHKIGPPDLPSAQQVTSGPGIEDKFLGVYRASQGLYFTASGTLTQFNAVAVAILAAAIAATGGPAKIVAVGALALHVLAAFLLCWAARPIDYQPTSLDAWVRFEQSNSEDSFRSYRRGWRMTLLALFASTVALTTFVFQSFDRPLSLRGLTTAILGK
jgi:hypothetical protein